jgi:hypothetical protein
MRVKLGRRNFKSLKRLEQQGEEEEHSQLLSWDEAENLGIPFYTTLSANNQYQSLQEVNKTHRNKQTTDVILIANFQIGPKTYCKSLKLQAS